MDELANREAYANLVLGSVLSLEGCALLLNLLLVGLVLGLATRNLSYALTLGICTVDLAFSLAALAKYMFRALLGEAGFFANTMLCNGLGTVTGMLMCASSMLVSLLAMERCLRVCRGRGLPRLLLGVAVAVSLALLASGIATGVTGGYRLDPVGVFCLPGDGGWAATFDGVMRLVMVGSLLVVVPCYVAIYVFCRRHGEGSPVKIRMARTLLPIALYCACFLPVATFIVLSKVLGADAVPKGVVMLAPIGAGTIPAANSVLVLFLNQQVRDRLAASFTRSPAPRESLPVQQTN